MLNTARWRMAIAWMLVSLGDQERILLCGDGKVLESLLLSLSLVGYFRTTCRLVGDEGVCGAVPPKFTVDILVSSKQDALSAPFDDSPG